MVAFPSLIWYISTPLMRIRIPYRRSGEIAWHGMAGLALLFFFSFFFCSFLKAVQSMRFVLDKQLGRAKSKHSKQGLGIGYAVCYLILIDDVQRWISFLLLTLLRRLLLIVDPLLPLPYLLAVTVYRLTLGHSPQR